MGFSRSTSGIIGIREASVCSHSDSHSDSLESAPTSRAASAASIASISTSESSEGGAIQMVENGWEMVKTCSFGF